MNSVRHHCYRILLTAVVIALDVLPVGAADVVLQAVVAPKSSVVCLGDVAKIVATDKREAERLAAIPLLPAPAPGQRRFVRMREVQDLLAAHGETMSDLDFRGELVVEVSTPADSRAATLPQSDRRAVWSGTSAVAAASMTEHPESQANKVSPGPHLTDAQIKEAENYVRRSIIEYLNRNGGSRAEWQVNFDVRPEDLAKVLEAKTALQCAGGLAPWTGQQRLVVAFSTAHGPVRMHVEADITAAHEVVVAAQPIERGHIITAADVAVAQWDHAPQSTARRQPVGSLDSIIGKEATRSIQQGDAVFSDDARAQVLVKRGQEIVVSTQGGGIRVSTIARARQDGARGELIGVESLEAKEPFEAVVVGPREAVVFTATTVPARATTVAQPFGKLRQK